MQQFERYPEHALHASAGAIRETSDTFTQLSPWRDNPPAQDTLMNGTMISYWVSDLQPFDELVALKEGEFRDDLYPA